MKNSLLTCHVKSRFININHGFYKKTKKKMFFKLFECNELLVVYIYIILLHVLDLSNLKFKFFCFS